MKSLSVQLFSTREFDLEETFKLLQAANVKEVEGFDPLYADPAALKAMMDTYGLSMPTGHFSVVSLEQDPQRIIDTAKTLGVELVIMPYIAPEERPSDVAGWKAFAERLKAAAAPIIAAGIPVAWHNHDFEYTALEDGSMPIQHIADIASDLKFEIDLSWVHRAGQDPVKWLSHFADRTVVVHGKDVAPAGENADEGGWADLGHGEVNWTGLFAELDRIGIQRMVLEHDNPNNQERFISRSVATANSAGWR